MNNPNQDLMSEVESFLSRTAMAPSIFGRDAIGDPNLVRNLKAGRELRFRTAQRVRDFMASQVEAAT